MANPRKRRMIKSLRLSHNKSVENTEDFIMTQQAREILLVSEEIPNDVPLVEVDLFVGEDEPKVVDEELLEELLPKKEETKQLSYSEKRKKAILAKASPTNKKTKTAGKDND